MVVFVSSSLKRSCLMESFCFGCIFSSSVNGRLDRNRWTMKPRSTDYTVLCFAWINLFLNILKIQSGSHFSPRMYMSIISVNNLLIKALISLTFEFNKGMACYWYPNLHFIMSHTNLKWSKYYFIRKSWRFLIMKWRHRS